MNKDTSGNLKLKSDELETRLRALRLGPKAKHFPELSDANCHVEDDRMNAIHHRLREKLDSANGISWELLRLEWQYDLALLAYSFAVFSSHLDTQFNTIRPVGNSDGKKVLGDMITDTSTPLAHHEDTVGYVAGLIPCDKS